MALGRNRCLVYTPGPWSWVAQDRLSNPGKVSCPPCPWDDLEPTIVALRVEKWPHSTLEKTPGAFGEACGCPLEL